MSESQANCRTPPEGCQSEDIIDGIQQTINNASGFVEERVKVDRKRFEQMLGENSTIGHDAESFFRRVMRSTNTQIMWPPKLKPGTKSKKDPHVRITGSPNSINAAKEIIFEQLDTRRNRVTLKMDVAFTDHSHIIGKGGRSIQRVMDETGCHIHFPDSNRTNTAEKSNQVSIAGSAEGVEQSRRRIREMLPITVQFDLPLNNGLHSPPTLDTQSPQLQAIQQSYGITITFRSDGSKCNNSYFASSRIITVAVRGARSHLFGLRQGLSVLIEYLTGFRANTINVPLTMTIDVAVQHHSFIGGRSNCNIRSIMQSTGAVITIPDLLINNSISSSSTSSLPAATNSTASSPLTRSSSSLAGINSQSSTSISDLSSLCGQQASFMTSLTNQTFHGSNPNLASNSIVGNLSNRKTAIVIKGPNFESVYDAWQELLGYLPLILIFDLKEGQDLDAVQVTKLMEQMRQISILIKPKQRQNTKSIVVRGPERDSRLLFEVRRQILKLDDSEVPSYNSMDQQEQQLRKQIQQLSHPLHHVQTSTFINGAGQVNNKQPLQATNMSSNLTTPELQMKAIRAILEPNFEKARPTPYWAGLGFSKSVSEPMIKEKIPVGPLFSSNLVEERRISHDLVNNLQSLSIDPTKSGNKISTDINNNTNGKISSCLRLAMFLGRLNLVQHLGLFTQHNIDLEMLFGLTENDLADLGLPYVHRRKLAIAISEVKSSLQNERNNNNNNNNNNISALANFSNTFDAAPGAERSKRQKAKCPNQGDLSDIWST